MLQVKANEHSRKYARHFLCVAEATKSRLPQPQARPLALAHGRQPTPAATLRQCFLQVACGMWQVALSIYTNRSNKYCNLW